MSPRPAPYDPRPPLRFKEPRMADEFDRVDIRLRWIVEDMHALALACVGTPLTVTEVWRQDGIHGAWRAVDVRVHDLPIEFRAWLAGQVNRRWRYGRRSSRTRREFLVCLYADGDPDGGHHDHYHVQVPPPLRSGHPGFDLRAIAVPGPLV